MSEIPESYNALLFTSPCCHAFNTYSGASIICSECGNIVTRLPDDRHLTISVQFNDHNTENVSGDLIVSFRSKAKRYADDPTYELCSKKCPLCSTLSRYARDPQGNMIFICSNPKCRNVFDSLTSKAKE